MAGQRGIVIKIEGDGESARRALEMVREQMQQTEVAAGNTSSSFLRLGSSAEHGVPQMAAASAAMRALEGNFTNNIRAGERFLSMLPGMSSLLQSAFPVVGATVLATALFEMGEKAYDAFENIVELKGALESLGQVDITVGKKVDSNSDAIESSVEQILEATQGHAAALKQKLQHEGSKPIDLSELFYDKSFSGLKDSIKTNYEDLYKSVAPADAPEKIRNIRAEIANLNEALRVVKSGEMGAFVPKVGGFGPTMLEDPEKYYKARIKAATDVQQLLSSEYDKRTAAMQATQAQLDKPPAAPKIQSDGRFAEAAAALVAEQSKATSNAQKSADQVQLAELDAQHKMLLVGDQAFYAEKLQLQTEELDAEEAALRKHQTDLQALYQQQRGDKTLKRGSDGQSAEELRTQRQMIANQEQLNALTAKRAQVSSENAAEVNQANLNAELAGLRAAAELERQRNDGIAAQIALLQRESQLTIQKSQVAGESEQTQQQLKDLEQIEEQKLRIADVDRQIQQTEETFNIARKQNQDAAAKGAMSKLAAERKNNELSQQEVAVLQSLVQQYDALAATLGGPYVQKAQELHAALSELSTPDKSKEPQFGKTLGEGITKMADTLVSQSIRGKTSFHQMVKEMEADAAELAIKLLTLQLAGKSGSGAGGGGGGHGGLGGLFSALFSHLPQFGGGSSSGGGGGATEGDDTIGDGSGMDIGSIPFFASGTNNDPAGPQVVGEEGPELWRPPVSGGSITPSGMLSKLADSGGAGGRAPNVTMNVVNQSSQPVTVQQQQTSWDSQAHEAVTNIVLKDLSSNGPIRQAFSGSMG